MKFCSKELKELSGMTVLEPHAWLVLLVMVTDLMSEPPMLKLGCVPHFLTLFPQLWELTGCQLQLTGTCEMPPSLLTYRKKNKSLDVKAHCLWIRFQIENLTLLSITESWPFAWEITSSRCFWCWSLLPSCRFNTSIRLPSFTH